MYTTGDQAGHTVRQYTARATRRIRCSAADPERTKMPKKTTSLTQAAKALGARGGKIGGPARARVLTPAQRSEIARKGGKARQAKRKQGGKS